MRASSRLNRRISSSDPSRLPSLTKINSHASPVESSAAVMRRRSSGRFSSSLKMGTTTEITAVDLTCWRAFHVARASRPCRGASPDTGGTPVLRFLNSPPQFQHQQRVESLRVIHALPLVIVHHPPHDAHV